MGREGRREKGGKKIKGRREKREWRTHRREEKGRSGEERRRKREEGEDRPPLSLSSPITQTMHSELHNTPSMSTVK